MEDKFTHALWHSTFWWELSRMFWWKKVLTSIVSSNVSMSVKDDQFLAQNWSILEQNLEFLFAWKEYCCALETLSKLTFFSYLTTPPKTPIVNYSFLSLKSSLNNPLNRTYILSPSGQVHAAMTLVGSLTPDCKTLNSLQADSLNAKNLSVGQSLDDGWQMLLLTFACSEGESKQLPTLLTH